MRRPPDRKLAWLAAAILAAAAAWPALAFHVLRGL
jgi:hypothetical protein